MDLYALKSKNVKLCTENIQINKRRNHKTFLELQENILLHFKNFKVMFFCLNVIPKNKFKKYKLINSNLIK